MADRNKVGSPPNYKSAEELQSKIDDYINNPPTIKHKSRDGAEFEVPSITISGLCWALGFASRQSFYDYEKRPEFSYTIKRARLFIENSYEEGLRSTSCTGSIFALKNMGWADGQNEERPPTNYKIEIVNPHVTD